MFEKEAETVGNEKIKENHQLARCARKSYKDGFKDGAEFGYNKCNTELIKAKELIQDLIDSLEVIDGDQIRELKVVKEAEQFLRKLEE